MGAELVKKRTAEQAKDDPHARCLPDTFIRSYGLPHMQKFMQVPGLLVMLDEMNANYRQIFTDGRPLPADPVPAWNGWSSATWEGDTLVVQSTGFRDDLWLDIGGSPLTDAAKTDRAHPASRLRAPRDRAHGRRSEGVHEAVDGQAEAGRSRRHRPDRRDLPREREILSTHGAEQVGGGDGRRTGLAGDVQMNRGLLGRAVGRRTVSAQWLNHPTPAMPRTADGKPNLSAPAPRTADGRPDLSGLWNRISPKYSRNIAADLKPGDVQPWAQALVEERRENLGKGYMNTICVPFGPSYVTSADTTGAETDEDRPDAVAHPDPQSGSHLSSGLHGWPRARARSQSSLDGIFGRPLGRRHAGHREQRLQRSHVARSRRASRTPKRCA